MNILVTKWADICGLFLFLGLKGPEWLEYSTTTYAAYASIAA
ncbi:hypothetical protein PI124_g1702 [Phytophthora idaei]|nr:hypothetical protein PI125_g6614 [Phytophthora idaei]KAG3133890.1 hypothetical protein PI126_g18962 [Phytophthora idaei]KAG3253739.1 hypothetical protein PI124_g1702 [Phytophthora idaei]